jgi:hypothetical protein
VKNIEYFLLTNVLVNYFKGLASEHAKKIFFANYLIVVAYSAFMFLVKRSSWNLLMPFVRYGSGAVMGAISCAVGIYCIYKAVAGAGKRYFGIYSVALLASALAQGRTQMLILILVTFLILINYGIKHDFRLIALGLILFIVIYLIYSFSSLNKMYGGNLFQYFNISKIFMDDSFMLRMALWEKLIGRWWNGSWVCLLFGNGIGFERYFDCLYVDMLTSLGLIGATLYFFVLIRMLWSIPSINWGFVVFLLITSITNELFLNSYRFIQVFLILFFIMSLDKEKISAGRLIHE